MKKVLLISNKVMHYRVSIYNYFRQKFNDCGWEFIVRGNELQKKNPHLIRFDFKEIPFNFFSYRREILRINPDVVILFLHLKDFIIWPMMHWLKIIKVPFVYWNKGINLEVRNPFIRNQLFYYVHNLSDGIILYSENERKHIKEKNWGKVSVANNTINFEDFPPIMERKEDIKKEFGVDFEKIVLFVGRLRKIKKIDHLIEIFQEIDLEGVGLVIVGEDSEGNIKKKINSKNTIYFGEIYDPENLKISKIFKMADVFCIPGEVGLSLNQAFYWGLPVVTEEGLQPPEISYLKNGINGFIVSENATRNLKDKLIFLLENDDRREEFSKNAREFILKEASIEKMFIGFKKCLDFIENRNKI